MKHTLLYGLLFSFLFTIGFSTTQAQVCAWAKQAGGNMNSNATAVVTDASGNVYVSGYFDNDSMHFGTSYINDTDSLAVNIYLAKYDSAGTFLWVKSFGGINSDFSYAMTIDASGNIYMAGVIESPVATFGTITITNTIGDLVFLAKLNSAGTPLWVKSEGGVPAGDDMDQATSVTTDASGNVYMTGYYQDSITFGSTTLQMTAMLGNSIFVVKYDPSGNVLWAKGSQGSGGDDESSNVTVDAANNVYVAGSYTSTSISFDGFTLPGGSADYMFLVKYNAAGTAVWANSASSSTGFVQSTGLATDAAGNVYVAGGFDAATAVFGSTTITNTDPSGNTDDIFLAKYNAAGSVVYAKSTGGNDQDLPNAIISDAAGNIYMGGMSFSSSITLGSSTLTYPGLILALYNTSGDPVWGKGASSPTSAGITSIAKDAFGHLYATGIYNFPLTMDGITLSAPATAYDQVFTARFDHVSERVPTVSAVPNDLTIFPNPTSTSLTITATENINDVVITNLIGQVVYTHQYNTQAAVVDVSALPTGIYLVKVNSGSAGATGTKKFVKE